MVKCPHFPDPERTAGGDSAFPLCGSALIFLTTISATIIIHIFFHQNKQDKNLCINVLSDHMTSRKLQKSQRWQHTKFTRFINRPS
jgi:hypothetical protein